MPTFPLFPAFFPVLDCLITGPFVPYCSCPYLFFFAPDHFPNFPDHVPLFSSICVSFFPDDFFIFFRLCPYFSFLFWLFGLFSLCCAISPDVVPYFFYMFCFFFFYGCFLFFPLRFPYYFPIISYLSKLFSFFFLLCVLFFPFFLIVFPLFSYCFLIT